MKYNSFEFIRCTSSLHHFRFMYVGKSSMYACTCRKNISECVSLLKLKIVT